MNQTISRPTILATSKQEPRPSGVLFFGTAAIRYSPSRSISYTTAFIKEVQTSLYFVDDTSVTGTPTASLSDDIVAIFDYIYVCGADTRIHRRGNTEVKRGDSDSALDGDGIEGVYTTGVG